MGCRLGCFFLQGVMLPCGCPRGDQMWRRLKRTEEDGKNAQQELASLEKVLPSGLLTEFWVELGALGCSCLLTGEAAAE